MSCGVAPYDPTTKTLNATSAFPILKRSYSITPHRYFCAWGMLLCVLLLATRKCALKTRGNIGGCVWDCKFPLPTIRWQYGGIWPCSHYSTKIGSFSTRDIRPFTTAPSTILVLQWRTLQHAHAHRRAIPRGIPPCATSGKCRDQARGSLQTNGSMLQKWKCFFKDCDQTHNTSTEAHLFLILKV